MNKKEFGDTTEAIAVARLKRLGYTVSRPFGETARYDLLLDTSAEILRIQCKTGWTKTDDRLIFKACSTEYNASGHHANQDYSGEIDAFVVRSPEEDSLYFIPIEDAPSREMTLRLEGSCGPDQNAAADYRLTKYLGNG